MKLYTENVRKGKMETYDPKNIPFDDYVNPENLRKIVPIFKEYEFLVNTDEEGNGGFQVSQQQMVFFEMLENLNSQYEIFHGQFILTGQEYGNEYEVNIQEPYRIQVTLQYPKSDVKTASQVQKKFDSQEDIKSLVGDKQDKTENPPWNKTDSVQIVVSTDNKTINLDVDQRFYVIDIFKYARKEEYEGKKYSEMGERASFPSHTYFEFWGIPNCQQNLMKANFMSKSYSNENYAEIIQDLQSERLGVKPQDDLQTGNFQNKPDKLHPLVIPQGVVLSTVFDNLRFKSWCTDEVDKPSPPIWFLNNNRINFKFPTQIRPDILDIWVGNMFQTQSVVNQSFEDAVQDLTSKQWNTEDENPRQPFSEQKLGEDNVGKITFPNFQYVQKSRGQMMGIYQKRNTKHILEGTEQEGQDPIPLKHKQTNWANLIHPEPYFSEIHNGEQYQEKYEYDQYYVDHEYSLEDRMGKKYWKQLFNSFMNMDLLVVSQNNHSQYNLLETMRLGLIVRQHFKDSNLIGGHNIIHNEDSQFFIYQRTNIMFPQLNQWRMEFGLGTVQKWQMYKEDPHGTFFCSVCKQFKQIRSYSFTANEEQSQIDPSKYEIVPFQYNERERQDIERKING